jgi:hypothetical protein
MDDTSDRREAADGSKQDLTQATAWVTSILEEPKAMIEQQ